MVLKTILKDDDFNVIFQKKYTLTVDFLIVIFFILIYGKDKINREDFEKFKNMALML